MILQNNPKSSGRISLNSKTGLHLNCPLNHFLSIVSSPSRWSWYNLQSFNYGWISCPSKGAKLNDKHFADRRTCIMPPNMSRPSCYRRCWLRMTQTPRRREDWGSWVARQGYVPSLHEIEVMKHFYLLKRTLLDLPSNTGCQFLKCLSVHYLGNLYTSV